MLFVEFKRLACRDDFVFVLRFGFECLLSISGDIGIEGRDISVGWDIGVRFF